MNEEKPKTILDFTQVIRDMKGEAQKDLINVDEGTIAAKQPDLTVGSLMTNGLTLGAGGMRPADAVKLFRVAKLIQNAINAKAGKLEVTEGDISQIEQAWQKVTGNPFTLVLYSGFVQNMLDEAKLELMRKISK